jgi:hypothetical protein
VTYNSDGRVQFQETWSVPSSTQPLRVRDVRTAASTQTSGTGVAASETNLAPIPESGVLGLVADLGARPAKSPGFAPGRAAVVDAGGLITTAAGSPTDCVHVDGSSGPCGGGAPAFVDADSPSGIVDGANTVFGLSTAPAPAGSVAVYRNGMLQKIGQDYTLSGSTIAFAVPATPQPGDTLLASYRVAGDSNAGAAGSFTSPQVLCSGSGASTNAASLSVLGTCKIAAGLLAAGDRVELRFDYAHAGNQGAVSIEVNWGGTTLAHRDAVSTETLISGRAAAAIVTGGAQLSAESWGAAMPFSAGVANASDGYASGLTITFRGSVGQSSDSITLANFSVVRVP